MFLRIDVYPGGGGGGASQQPLDPCQKIEPDQTLYAYPAIASANSANDNDNKDNANNDDNTIPSASLTLLTVGRKDPADVRLPQDKSVSRMHCAVKLVPKKNNKKRGESEEGKIPVTDFVVVLENTSRTGCYIARPRTKKELSNTAVVDDSDATDAEEGDTVGRSAPNASSTQTQHPLGSNSQAASQQQQPQRLSLAAVQILQSSSGAAGGVGQDDAVVDLDDYDLELVGANQTNELYELDKNGGMVILQCGKLDSTLVITRQDLLVHYKTKAKLDDSFLASIGACAVEERYGSYTHLITNTYSPTTSQLFAWCRQATFVTQGYLLALGRRTSAKDPMPHIQEYRPEGGRVVVGADGEEEELFWSQPPPNWNVWTYLTEKPTKADAEEMVHFIRATGAKVVEIGTNNDLQNMQIPTNSFALASKRLLTKTILKQAGVLVCDKKELATKLTQQKYPDGNPAPVQQQQQQQQQTVAVAAALLPPPPPPPPPVDPTQPPAPREEEPSKNRERASRRRNERTAQSEHVSEVERPRQQSPTPVALPEHGKKPKRATTRTNNEDDDQMESGGGASSKKRHRHDDVVDGDVHKDDDSSFVELRPRKKAKPLENGWFVAVGAAEKNNNNKKKTDSSSQAEGDEDHVAASEPAATDLVKGILLDTPLGQSTKSNRSSSNSSRVDFRAFRKNSVVAADKNLVVSIKLVSVPATENHSSAHMEEQRLELEERHRLAEALFRDRR